MEYLLPELDFRNLPPPTAKALGVCFDVINNNKVHRHGMAVLPRKDYSPSLILDESLAYGDLSIQPKITLRGSTIIIQDEYINYTANNTTCAGDKIDDNRGKYVQNTYDMLA